MACNSSGGRSPGAVLNTMSNDAGSGWNKLGPFGGLAGGAFGGVSCGIFGKCSKPSPPTEVDVNFNNDIVATAVFNAIQDCEGSDNLGQRLTTSCEEEAPGFADNLGCQTCNNVKAQLLASRRTLELDAARNDKNYQIQNLSGNTAIQWSETDALNFPCTYASCLSCAYRSLDQNSAVHMDTECQNSLRDTSAIENKIADSTQQAVKSKEDVLGLLGGFLTSDSQDCMVNDMSNRIISRLTSDVKSSILANVAPSQRVEFARNSKSIYVDKFSQGINLSSIAGIVGRTNITSNLYTSVEKQDAQTLYYSNDTIDELASDLGSIAVGFSQTLNSLVGRTLLILGIIMAAFVIAVVGILSIKPELARSIGLRV